MNDTKMDWHKHFAYDATSGTITRISGGGGALMWLGKVAGNLHWTGYLRVAVQGKEYHVHRIIWEMHNGPIPDRLVVDHIDGIQTNNRLENLRLATKLENAHNSKLPKHNTSGIKGVRKAVGSKKWISRLKEGKKLHHLGTFDTPDEAHRAYVEAGRKLCGDFFRG